MGKVLLRAVWDAVVRAARVSAAQVAVCRTFALIAFGIRRRLCIDNDA